MVSVCVCVCAWLQNGKKTFLQWFIYRCEMWKLMCLNTTCYYIRCFYTALSFIHSHWHSVHLYHTRFLSHSFRKLSRCNHTHTNSSRRDTLLSIVHKLCFDTAVYFTCRYPVCCSIYTSRLRASTVYFDHLFFLSVHLFAPFQCL